MTTRNDKRVEMTIELITLISEIAGVEFAKCVYRRTAQTSVSVTPSSINFIKGRRAYDFTVIQLGLADPVAWRRDIFDSGRSVIAGHFIFDIIKDSGDEIIAVAGKQGRGTSLKIAAVRFHHKAGGWEADPRAVPAELAAGFNPPSKEEIEENLSLYGDIYYSIKTDDILDELIHADGLDEPLRANAKGCHHSDEHANEIASLDLAEGTEAQEEAFAAAHTLHHAGFQEQALDLLNTLLVSAPEMTKAWFLKGRALWLSDRTVEALDAYSRAVATAPDNEQVRLGRAFALNGLHLIDELEAEAKTILRINPASETANYYLGAIALQRRQWELAKALLDYASSKGPKAHDPDHLLGHACIELRLYKEAAKAFKRSLEICPAHLHIHRDFASALCQAGRLDLGIKHFTRLVSFDPNDLISMRCLGTALLNTENFADAIPLLERVHSEGETDSDLKYSLALAYLLAGREEDARHLASEAAQLSVTQGAQVLNSLQ